MPQLLSCVHRLPDGHLCGENSTRSRCPEHRRVFESQRKEEEPYRWLYDDPRWRSMRQKVLARDGFRCTFQIGARRCNTDVPSLLECHHEEKLRDIWARCGKPQRGAPGWARFVKAACDMRNLRTLCTEHHKYVDNVFKDGIRRQAEPGVRATSQFRRAHRSGKRRSLKHIKAPARRPRKRKFESDD